MKKVFLKTAKMIFLVVASVISFILFVGVLMLSQIPSDKEIKSCLTTKLYKVRLCPDSGQYARLSQISPYLQKTIVLTEDSSFWQHNGFDLGEMQKSLETNLKKGSYARGGSTITQQLAKNLFLSKDKTLLRKGLEAIITLRLEKNLSKKEILEKYLNVVQFGPDVFGVKRASQYYFKKAPADLDVIESSFLAFLLPSPEKYSKSFLKKELTPFARERLNQILNRLYEYERISGEDYETARSRIDTFLTGEKPVLTPEIESIDEEGVEEDADFGI